MDLEEYKSYVRFSEEDGDLLRLLWPHVRPGTDKICEVFYAQVLGHGSTRQVLSDPATAQRLMVSLRQWLFELLNGPWDDEYLRSRERIGLRHIDVGVDHSAMFASMSVVMQELSSIALTAGVDPARTLPALSRVLFMDLMLMTRSFHESQRVLAERTTQSMLVEHIPAVAILLDARDQVLAATPAVRDHFGRSGDPGVHYTAVLTEDFIIASELPLRLERARETGRQISVPRVHLESGGARVHYALWIVPVGRARGEMLLYIEDHSLAVENEARLRRQESLARLGAMSATIAHELRNPLAGISGVLQVIHGEMDPADGRAEIMGEVVEQVQSLDRLVSDLLAFARPNAPRIQRDADLLSIVQSVASMLAEDVRKEIIVRVSGRGRSDIDPDMLRQILNNLLINACQALGGTGEVRIEVEPHRVIIADSGPGLSPDARAHLFESFFTTKVHGTGLGLATCQKLAQAMNGRIELVEKHPLGGAAFAVVFGDH